MFNVKDEHGHYNLWRQTGLALLPLLLAIIAYPLLPNRVYVPTAVTSLTPWGIKSNIFIYPVFCLILWFFIWLFIFFNRFFLLCAVKCDILKFINCHYAYLPN